METMFCRLTLRRKGNISGELIAWLVTFEEEKNGGLKSSHNYDNIFLVAVLFIQSAFQSEFS